MGLLNSLIESADRFKDGLLPTGYAERDILWVINFDTSDKDPPTVNKSGKGETKVKAPEPLKDRTSGKISPCLLVDKPSYALGLPDTDKKGNPQQIADEEHSAFVRLLNDAAAVTKNSTLSKIATAVSAHAVSLRGQLHVGANDKSKAVAFQVGSEPWATDDRAVQQYWSNYVERRLGTTEQQTCVVCGQEKPATRIMPFSVGRNRSSSQANR